MTCAVNAKRSEKLWLALVWLQQIRKYLKTHSEKKCSTKKKKLKRLSVQRTLGHSVQREIRFANPSTKAYSCKHTDTALVNRTTNKPYQKAIQKRISTYAMHQHMHTLQCAVHYIWMLAIVSRDTTVAARRNTI